MNPEPGEPVRLSAARAGSIQPTIAKRGFSTGTTGSAIAQLGKKTSRRALAPTSLAPLTHSTSRYAIVNQSSNAKPFPAQPGSRAA